MAKIAFTAGRVSGFKCPPDKAQAFLWDATAPGLGLRATPAGKPAYIFQGAFGGKDIRLTIGSPGAWSIPQAQAKAREFQRLIDEGTDPRSLKAEKLAAAETEKQRQQEAKQAAAIQAVTLGEAWAVYLEARRPHWGDRHHADHIKLSDAGGQPFKRGKGTTQPGPLHPLMALPLRDLTAQAVEAWAAKEGKTRPTSARLAWRCLKAFLSWCAEQPEYATLVTNSNPAKTKKAREALGKAGVKQDALLKEQLPAWFAAVLALGNPTIAAYLQILLLTGARPGEVLAMRWEDVDTQWRGLTIRDKVEGERVIPLTPYVHHLLAALPRRGPLVFASNPRGNTDTGGTIARPSVILNRLAAVVGVEVLTLHGLRRSSSFRQLKPSKPVES